jgi:hypothetical protein
MPMNVARALTLTLWMAFLVLRLSLPAWDVCLHRDGQVCDEAVPRSCCSADPPAGEPVDEDCAGCTDLHLEPGASPRPAPAAGMNAAPDLGRVAAVLACHPAPHASPGDLLRLSGAAPPDQPGRHTSIPLRC